MKLKTYAWERSLTPDYRESVPDLISRGVGGWRDLYHMLVRHSSMRLSHIRKYKVTFYAN